LIEISISGGSHFPFYPSCDWLDPCKSHSVGLVEEPKVKNRKMRRPVSTYVIDILDVSVDESHEESVICIPFENPNSSVTVSVTVSKDKSDGLSSFEMDSSGFSISASFECQHH
jgi:hypothetical protein